jgi:hypothetical protein
VWHWHGTITTCKASDPQVYRARLLISDYQVCVRGGLSRRASIVDRAKFAAAT